VIHVCCIFQVDIFGGLKKCARNLCAIGWIVVVSEVTISRCDIFIPSDFCIELLRRRSQTAAFANVCHSLF
jgi:hypothetical protein